MCKAEFTDEHDIEWYWYKCEPPKLEEEKNPVLLLLLLCHAKAAPPYNLKRGGVESSGQRLISSISKTKKVTILILFLEKEKNVLKV